MIYFNASPELQKCLTIANTLDIDELIINNFMIAFVEFGGFAAFRADAPDAAGLLERLNAQALCLRIIDLDGEQQAWLRARVQRDIEAGLANGSLLNQVRAIIDLSSGLDELIAQFTREQQAQAEQAAREQQAQATLRRENAEAKELLLELLTARLNDEERVETATGFIDAALLSLTTEQEKSNWLTEKTAGLCQEQTYLICQSLGLPLNQAESLAAANDKQAESLAAVNDKITARIPEAEQQAARDCLTVVLAAKPAAEQLAYLSSISSDEAAFAGFLALSTQRARQMQDFERQIASILRFVRKITDPQVIAGFKSAMQQAFPLDITRQQALFNEYETAAKADFSLQGFQQFLDSKKPQPVAAPIAPAAHRRNTTSSSSSSNPAVVTPAFNAAKKQAAEKTAKRKKETAAPTAEKKTSTRQLRPRKNGDTTKQ